MFRTPLLLLLTLVLSTLMAVALPGIAWTTEITRGPYLQNASSDAITIVWDQDTPSSPVVRFGIADLDDNVVATTEASHHEVRLEGLEPGTTYQYAVFEGDEPLLDEPLSFPTAVVSSEPFSFVVIGDTRSNPDMHASIVDAATLEDGVRFYFNTGDLVASGEILAEWEEFFRLEAPLISRIPLYPIIGNHDEADGNADNYKNSFVLPRNSPAPEAYYSFDYGNIHFAILDGHINVMPWFFCIFEGLAMNDCFDGDQVEWLTDDLQTASLDPSIDHIFVMTHVGPYSSKEGRNGNAHMRALLDLFLNTGVTAMISGHDHYYERGSSPVGIPYVISGGGGAPLYGLSDPGPGDYRVSFHESIHHYMLFDVYGPYIHVSTKTSQGDILEEFDLGERPECIDDTDCVGVPLPDGCAEGDRLCQGWSCVAECTVYEPDPTPDAGIDEPDVGYEPDLVEDTSDEIVPDLGHQSDSTTSEDEGSAPPSGETGEAEACGCRTGDDGSQFGLFSLFAFLAIFARRGATVRERNAG